MTNPAGLAASNRPLIAAWATMLVLCLLVWMQQAVLVRAAFHDISVVLDAARRATLGQVPHVDYRTPIGSLFTLPYAVLGSFEPFSALFVPRGNVVVVLFLLVSATILFRARLHGVALFAAIVGALLVALSPRAFHESPLTFVHLAPYNRWCQAIAMLVVFVIVPRRQPSRTGDLVDGLVVGLLLGFVAYVKISYALGIGGIVAAATLLGRVGWRAALAAVLTMLGVAALVQLSDGNLATYLADLGMASRATFDVHHGPHLLNRKSSPAIALLLGMFALVRLRVDRRLAGRSEEGWRVLVDPTLVLIALAGAMLMNLQNNFQKEVPTMGAIALAAEVLARRHGDTLRLPALRLGATLFLWLAVLFTPVLDLTSIVAHAILSRGARACVIPALAGTPYAPLRVLPGDERPAGQEAMACPPSVVLTPAQAQEGQQRLEMRRLEAGLGLLRGRLRPDDRVLALDFSNPYPQITGTMPPQGALLWWHLGRTYSAAHRPDPVPLLADVRFVLQSTQDYRGDDPHGANAWMVYGPDVRRAYRPVAQLFPWVLWERRGGARQP